MEMSVQEIWESCLEKIKDAIPEICYATWFKDLEPAELFQDILFIRFPDDGKHDFQQRILKGRYLPLIKQVVSEVRQKKTGVKILDDSDNMIFVFVDSSELSKTEIEAEK